MHTLVTTILEDTYTKQSLAQRLRILREYTDSVTYKKKTAITLQEEEWLTSFLKKIKESELSEMLLKQTNLFSNIEDEIKSIPELVMFIPIALPAEVEVIMGQKVRVAANNLIIIDIRIDPKLIAGASFAYKGIMKDYSLNTKLPLIKQTFQNELKIHTEESSN